MALKVRKHSKSSYELRYTDNGYQKSIYGRSRLECRNKLRDLKSLSRKPRLAKGMVFNVWFEKWVDLYKKNYLKKNTLKNLIGIFKNYILPSLENKQIRQVKTADIQTIINNMSNLPRQATIAFTQLNSCFNQAFIQNLIAYNPCSAVVIKKTNGNKGIGLTKEQEKILIDYLNKINPPIKNLIFLYLGTGMRRSELLNIKYSDINFIKNEIHICGTKTKNSNRIIQTKPEILALFPKKAKPFEDWSPNMVNSQFKKICNALGFKNIKLHSLRHTFATRCIENGVEMVVVQSWLGHASISLTIDTYTHIEDDFKKKELEKVSYLF